MDAEIVGSISKTIARQIGRKSGKVVVDKSTIDHIVKRHSVEFAQLGLSAIAFVRYVLQNFNEIRKGRTNELFLVVRNGLSKAAIIRMNLASGAYKVETATVMRESFINKKELIWKK